MAEHLGRKPNSTGLTADREDSVFNEELLPGAFAIILSAEVEKSERERMVEAVKAQASADGLDPARVNEIYEQALATSNNRRNIWQK